MELNTQNGVLTGSPEEFSKLLGQSITKITKTECTTAPIKIDKPLVQGSLFPTEPDVYGTGQYRFEDDGRDWHHISSPIDRWVVMMHEQKLKPREIAKAVKKTWPGQTKKNHQISSIVTRYRKAVKISRQPVGKATISIQDVKAYREPSHRYFDGPTVSLQHQTKALRDFRDRLSVLYWNRGHSIPGVIEILKTHHNIVATKDTVGEIIKFMRKKNLPIRDGARKALPGWESSKAADVNIPKYFNGRM